MLPQTWACGSIWDQPIAVAIWWSGPTAKSVFTMTKRAGWTAWTPRPGSSTATRTPGTGWCAQCLPPTGSRPAHPSCCGGVVRWRATTTCRCACIAASRGWNTIWSYSSTAKARWNCYATLNSLPAARSCRTVCSCRGSTASPIRLPISTSLSLQVRHWPTVRW